MNALHALEAAKPKRALFAGETIIDVYHFVSPLGRPLKESIVSVQHQRTEKYRGGVVAAAAHARDFCAQVDIHSTGHPVKKERWVEAAHVRKLFEVYSTANDAYHEPMPDLDQYDVVIVTDYGHGMMTPTVLDALTPAKFLAVNVQTNSGNFGFNLATKYSALNPNYLVVDEPEARLATQNKDGPIEESLGELQSCVAERVVITLGKFGAIGQDSSGVHAVTALTDRVVDTIGAGDAFFAITALVAETASMPDLLQIGNAALQRMPLPNNCAVFAGAVSQALDETECAMPVAGINTGTVYLIGNGGSAGICSHIATDILKFRQTPVVLLTDPALITCFANDYGYD
jgi:hypothetical protein